MFLGKISFPNMGWEKVVRVISGKIGSLSVGGWTGMSVPAGPVSTPLPLDLTERRGEPSVAS